MLVQMADNQHKILLCEKTNAVLPSSAIPPVWVDGEENRLISVTQNPPLSLEIQLWRKLSNGSDHYGSFKV